MIGMPAGMNPTRHQLSTISDPLSASLRRRGETWPSCCRRSSRRPTCKRSRTSSCRQLTAGDPRRTRPRAHHPAGPLRQQSRRRRALPGPAPDLRLPPGPADLGHRPSDLSAQADHRPLPTSFHTIRTKGGLMGYPNPAESALRPVHDRPRRLQRLDRARA